MQEKVMSECACLMFCDVMHGMANMGAVVDLWWYLWVVCVLIVGGLGSMVTPATEFHKDPKHRRIEFAGIYDLLEKIVHQSNSFQLPTPLI